MFKKYMVRLSSMSNNLAYVKEDHARDSTDRGLSAHLPKETIVAAEADDGYIHDDDRESIMRRSSPPPLLGPRIGVTD